jgi:hypothetical protein
MRIYYERGNAVVKPDVVAQIARNRYIGPIGAGYAPRE